MPSLADFELSIRRSRIRRDTMLALSSLSEARLTQLARYLNVDPSRVKWALHGKPPHYREELALVPLGLAEEVWTPNGRVYRVTSRGRRKARQITARWARRRRD